MLFVSCNNIENYYDKDWKITNKENASFFRVKPIKTGKGWLIKDYYITGELQYKGVCLDTINETWDGDLVWYYKTGRVISKKRFKNGVETGVFIGFEGMDSSDEGYLEEELRFSNSQGKAEDAIDVASYIDDKDVFYKNSKQVAIEKNYFPKNTNKRNYYVFYYQNGDSIGKVFLDKMNNNVDGNEAVFYKEKDSCLSVKRINTFSKKLLSSSIFFDENENELSSGSFIDGLPYNGTFHEVNDCGFYTISTYKNSVLLQKEYYDTSNKELGTHSLEKGKIDSGTIYTCESAISYKNGKMNGDYVKFEHGTQRKIVSKHKYKEGLKNGVFEYYHEDHITAKGNYKDDQLTQITVYEHDIHKDDLYYYKCKIKQKNKVSFIVNIKKYDVKNNRFIKEFKLKTDNNYAIDLSEPNKLLISELSFNAVSFPKLLIISGVDDKLINHYYSFNPKSNNYSYQKEFFNTEIAFTDIDTNTKYCEMYSSNNKVKDSVIYSLKKGDLFEKTSHVQSISFDASYLKDVTTQIYPQSIKKFPLLGLVKPVVFIIQGSKRYELNPSKNIPITLEKQPFSIEYITYPYTEGYNNYCTQLSASYNLETSNLVKTNVLLEDIAFFKGGTTMAIGYNDLPVKDYGHFVFIDSEAYKNVVLKEKISDDLYKYEYIVKEIDGNALNESFTINKPNIYLNIVTDKNLNNRIEQGELFKLTLNFK